MLIEGCCSRDSTFLAAESRGSADFLDCSPSKLYSDHSFRVL